MSALDSLAASLENAIGGNSEKQKVDKFVSTSFEPLNQIICGDYLGGMPQGRLVEIYGPSSSGKTAIATLLMIEAQRQGGIAGFMDHERSFNLDLAKSMGLNDTFPLWIYKQPRTWEEGNTAIIKAAEAIRKSKAIADDAPILFVFDSIAAALPKSMVEKGMDEYTMNDTTALARVTSTTLKTMAYYSEEFNFTVIYLNQTRMKPGVVYGDPTTTPGGSSMEFYATVRLAITRKKIVDDDKEFVGQEIAIKTVKNKLTRPFQEVSLRMAFRDDGMAYFDTTTSLINYLIEKGKIPYSKPRVTFDGKQYFIKALVKHIDDNKLYPELVKLL